MNKITCCVITDILELYADGVVSEDTKSLVETHLSDCSDCREKLAGIKKIITIPAETKAEPIKRIRKKIKNKFIITCTGLVFGSLLICIGIVFTVTGMWSVPFRTFEVLKAISESPGYTNSTPRIVTDSGRWASLGCAVNTPHFIYPPPNKKVFTYGWSEEAFVAVSSPGWNYAHEVIKEYENCANLDYKITVVKDERLTISYFGFGYPEEGGVVPLIKQFIFDLSGDLPVLIIVDGEPVPDSDRWIYYYPWLDEKPEYSIF